MYNVLEVIYMDKHMRVLDLLNQRQIKEKELNNLVYGSPEVRDKDNKKCIYDNIKEDGIQSTKYIGEYSEELYNLVLNNNLKKKEIKKDIRQIDKELKGLDYIDEELSKEVSINIDFARKHLADTIYKQAILEGVATTLSDTENIIEGRKVNNMSSEDIMKIVNLKHAWDFILNKNVILSPTDYSILSTINKLIEEGFYYNAGILRSTPVKIGGTNWTPPIPVESDIKEDINNLLKNKKDDVDAAIDLLLYVVRKQMFLDGNKRTSVVFANHYLISKGKGLIVIPVEKVEEYKKLLIDFYESNNKEKIFNFIKDNCYLSLGNI